MKSVGIYLAGYVVLVGGLIAALWKLGVLDRVGSAWTAIGIVIAIGLGIMLSVSMGKTKTVEVEEKR
ncbi:MAG: hypothetical protein NT151_06060 [Acidobacteria bacterium]|jgi:hypothetical protein|nr:hypothetical protein [Acidobacteriota bacterium]